MLLAPVLPPACAGLSGPSGTAFVYETARAQEDTGELFGEPNPAEHGLPPVRERGEAGRAWKVTAYYYLAEGE